MVMRMRECLALGLLVVLLTGCAAQEPRRFAFNEGAHGIPRLWPEPPDVPRYAWSGQITGEANLVSKKEPGPGFGAALRWLAGLLAGDTPPVILQRPIAGVVDANGRILITDTSRQGVFVFDPTAGDLQIWERADMLRGFQTPTGIATCEEGVWVADADLGFVARLDLMGNPVARVGEGLLKRPTGVAWDAANQRLYVADTHAHNIQVFSAAGKLLETLGERGEAPGQFNYPTHLALRNGELHVADTLNGRVQVLPLAGGAPRIIGQRGLNVGDLVRPKGVSVDSEGNVYVVESYYDHLLVYNRQGEFLMPIGGAGQEEGKFYLPAGVWIDPHDQVYVADMFNGRIMVFQFLGGDEEGAN